jgi:hypothetical protein
VRALEEREDDEEREDEPADDARGEETHELHFDAFRENNGELTTRFSRFVVWTIHVSTTFAPETLTLITLTSS